MRSVDEAHLSSCSEGVNDEGGGEGGKMCWCFRKEENEEVDEMGD